MASTKRMRLVSLLATASVLIVFGTSIRAQVAEQRGQASLIRMAPAAPVFDQEARHAELAGRRARVASEIGNNGVLVLFSAEPRVYTGDVNYEYRQENNLYYLTNLKQGRAALVLLPGNTVTPQILFMQRRIPSFEAWDGHMYSPEEAYQASGIKEIWEESEFEPFIRALRNRQAYRPKAEKILMTSLPADTAPGVGFEQLFAAAGKNEAVVYLLAVGPGESVEYPRAQRLSVEWNATPTGFSVRSAASIFAKIRQVKSSMEIAYLQHAMDITGEAQQRAWIAAGQAKWEFEIDALVAYTFRLRNADHWGYPSILGCGANTTTLHYDAVQGECKPGDLLLMDIGAEYEHYSADVTRTVPVSGKFSAAQAEVYQIVFNAQESAAKAARPGVFISNVDRAATEVIKAGLLKLGLITDARSNQFRIWFMHNTCHWLGMNVHDVGNSGARLEPGMVFTNEPGIYVRPDALDYKPFGFTDTEWVKFREAIRPAFEKYKNIGVRIEDDMLVTPDGVKWMTADLPRSIQEIESFITRARREAR